MELAVGHGVGFSGARIWARLRRSAS